MAMREPMMGRWLMGGHRRLETWLEKDRLEIRLASYGYIGFFAVLACRVHPASVLRMASFPSGQT
jgi:hypothetical protein